MRCNIFLILLIIVQKFYLQIVQKEKAAKTTRNEPDWNINQNVIDVRVSNLHCIFLLDAKNVNKTIFIKCITKLKE